jgi:hypothetical protein
MAAPDWISPWADRGSRGGARVFFNQYGLTRTGMGGCKGPRNGRRQTRYYPPARPAFLSLHYRFPTRYQVIPFIFLPRVYIRYSSGLEFVLSSQSLTKTTTGLVARTETLIYRPGPGKLSHSGIWQKGGGSTYSQLGRPRRLAKTAHREKRRKRQPARRTLSEFQSYKRISPCNLQPHRAKMLPSTLLALTSAALVSSHTVITYPGWRGDNLITNATFPYGMQWMYPCE